MKSKTFLIGLALILVLNSCIQPSDEDIARAIEKTRLTEQTSTPRATKTPIITEIKCSIEEEQREEWETVYCDTFDVNQNQIWTGTNVEYGLSASIRDGKYIFDYISDNQHGFLGGWTTPVQFWESKDYVVSLQGEIKSIFKECGWGILVRGDIEKGYEFLIDNYGNYFLTSRSLPGEYIGNAKNGSHSSIKWEQPNTITAVVEGEDMTFYVNGTPILSYECADTSRKEISLVVYGSEGVTVTYEIDNIIVREK